MSTTVTARASLPVRIAIAVIAAISVVGVLGIVNLASVSNYNQATDSLNANIKASQQQDADFDKLQTQQQQTDAQFREAGAAGMLLLPNVRTSIEHNAEVSAKLTESIRKKIGEMQHADGTEADTAIEGGQSVTDGGQGNGGTLTDEQRQKVEELLAQNAQSAQSIPMIPVRRPSRIPTKRLRPQNPGRGLISESYPQACRRVFVDFSTMTRRHRAFARPPTTSLVRRLGQPPDVLQYSYERINHLSVYSRTGVQPHQHLGLNARHAMPLPCWRANHPTARQCQAHIHIETS